MLRYADTLNILVLYYLIGRSAVLEIESKMVRDPSFLATTCQKLREEGKRIVLTTGVYDIIHKGHVKYLLTGKKMGDFLVVGINTDRFVRELKGSDRPINCEEDRAFVVASFGFVDLVYIFHDRSEIVNLVRPNTFVMSNTSHAKPESRKRQQDIVRRYGGEIVILEKMADIHTSDIVERLRP